MSTQNNKATIHCVCEVIRLHMLEAERLNATPHPDFDIFLVQKLKDTVNLRSDRQL